MKKIFAIVLALAFLFVLVGCDPVMHTISKEDLLANTVKVELYEYQNTNPKLISISGIKKPHFDFDNATLIAELNETYFEELINDLPDYYRYYGTALNEPMGKTLVLYQRSGNMYVLFGCPYTNEAGKNFYYGECYVFNDNGELVEYIGRVGHLFGEEIASKYFQNNP